jgi:hypothetical protein
MRRERGQGLAREGEGLAHGVAEPPQANGVFNIFFFFFFFFFGFFVCFDFFFFSKKKNNVAPKKSGTMPHGTLKPQVPHHV